MDREAGIAFELPLPPRGCAEPDCDVSGLASTDVYCLDHSSLIPLAGKMKGRRDWVLVNLGRMAILAGFPLAAQIDNPLPLQGLFLCAAMAYIALHLFRYPATARAETAALAVFGLLMLFSGRIHSDWRPLVFTLVVVMVIVIWIGVCVRKISQHESSAGRRSENQAAVNVTGAALIGGTGVAMVWLFLDVAPDALVYADARDHRQWLLVAAVAALATAITTSAIGGLLAGGKEIDREVADRWRLSKPERQWSITPPKEPRKRRQADVVERSAFVVRMLIYTVAVAAVKTLHALFDAATRAGYLAAHAVVKVLNVAQRRLRILARRFAASLVASGRVAARAGMLAVTAGIATARVILVPAAALCASAALLVAAGRHELDFLIAGSWSSLAQVLGLAAAASVLLTGSWVLAVDEEPVASIKSAVRNGNLAAPLALLSLAVGGWLVGLPGTLGYGIIHVGPVTITSSVALAGAYVWTRHVQGPEDETEADRPRETPIQQVV